MDKNLQPSSKKTVVRSAYMYIVLLLCYIGYKAKQLTNVKSPNATMELNSGVV